MNKRNTVACFIFLFFLFQGIAQQYRFFNDQNPKFYIKEIEREDWQIIIEFNLAVNPETVTPHAILINGEPLPAEVKFLFNRKGDKLAIYELPQWNGIPVTIEIKNIMSYNNLNLNPLSPLFMYPEDEYEWDD